MSKVLAVFCYDVSENRARYRLSRLLENEATRVQESVFEGWMSERRATAIAERGARLIDPQDSLRVYILSPGEAVRTRVFGATPTVEAHEFHLL